MTEREFARHVINRREELGITNYQIASESLIGLETIRGITRGKKSTDETRQAILGAFDRFQRQADGHCPYAVEIKKGSADPEIARKQEIEDRLTERAIAKANAIFNSQNPEYLYKVIWGKEYYGFGLS